MTVIASASETIQCEKRLQIRPRACAAAGKRGRTFLHIDLDSFFASVEQVKNPRLKGKPVIVGGRNPTTCPLALRANGRRPWDRWWGNSRRGVAPPPILWPGGPIAFGDRIGGGVVAACSYEAKHFGITNGMPWPQAKQKCPSAIFLPADFDAYADYSGRVRKILEKMAPAVAPASVDESYIDLAGCNRLYGTPRNAAEKIHQAIFKKTGLRTSIGIAASQSVAKIASKMAKPAGMMEVASGEEARFLAPLDVETMPGIGSALGERLRAMGVVTLGQLASLPPALLRASFGVYGPFLRAKARGEDTWELEATEVIKSIGKQRTLEKDITTREEVERELWSLVELVGKKLREENLYARTVHVHIRYGDFTPPPVRWPFGPMAEGHGTGGGVTGETASKALRDPTNFDRVLFALAKELIKPLINGRPIRLVGFTSQNLSPRPKQLDLFRTPASTRWERFYKSLDRVRKKWGDRFLKVCQ